MSSSHPTVFDGLDELRGGSRNSVTAMAVNWIQGIYLEILHGILPSGLLRIFYSRRLDTSSIR